MKDIQVPISPGELLDKITILRIKAARMKDAGKVANVKHELALLEKTWKDSGAAGVNLGAEEANLTRVNEKLWVIEDDIRDEERAQRFGDEVHRAGACRVRHQRRTRGDQEAHQYPAGLDHRRRKVLPAVLNWCQAKRKTPGEYQPPQCAGSRYRCPDNRGAAAPLTAGRARRAQVHDRRRQTHQPRRIPAAHRKSPQAHGQARHRRVAHRARRIDGVFHRRALVAQRTAHGHRAAARRRHRHRHAALRSPLGQRNAGGSGRAARVARGPESAGDRGRHPARSQGQGPAGHRRDRALLRHRRADARHARRGRS